MTTPQHARTAVTYRHGDLPVPPRNYYDGSALVTYVDRVMRAGQWANCGAIISGPIGIGKTTAIAESARRLDCEPVYINLFGTMTPLDQMKVIWRALTGTEAAGTAPVIRDQILDTLLRKKRTLLIDDAHTATRTALNSILAIYDTHTTARGHGLPIVLCGNDLERHLKQTCPQLLSRCGLGKERKPMAGQALLDLLFAMEPRIAGTDPQALRYIDNYQFKGDLRRWRDFFTFLDMVRKSEDPAPLTTDEIDMLLGIMPMGTR